jgi:phosphate transport system substrate-binding protein
VVLLGGSFKPAYRKPGGKDLSLTLADAIAGDRYAIGFVGLAYTTGQIKALALAERAGGPYAQPMTADVAAGRYPLDRPFFIYLNRPPGKPLDPLAREFLTFVLSKEGQDLVAPSGNLPVPANIAAAERARLE